MARNAVLPDEIHPDIQSGDKTPDYENILSMIEGDIKEWQSRLAELRKAWQLRDIKGRYCVRYRPYRD